MRDMLSKHFNLTESYDECTLNDYCGDAEPTIVNGVKFAVVYVQESQKITNLPVIPGVIFLNEAYFDLDIDAYFNEAK
jgi:hypothetical protein